MANFPKVGELILVTCTKITPHGAYFILTDYEDLGNEAGFVHISELSRTWVRNIRSHIKEGQRTVAKVQRVNTRNVEVDLSIRRVSEQNRRLKLSFYKTEARSTGIVKAVGEKFKLSSDEIKSKLLLPLKENYGSVSEALIQSREDGSQLLIDAGIPEDIAKELHALAMKELEPPSVTLKGIIDLTVYEPRGVEIIKDVLTKALTVVDGGKTTKKGRKTIKSDSKDKKSESIELNSISAPKYRVVINALEWKDAEKIWKNMISSIEKGLKSVKSEFSYARE
ncbi:MAG: S1 RNA-binding domain-containing protein [Candidatus Hodarchaeales archaeon]